MQGFLVEWYGWIKALHVISVISWMAGMFYLPRLFVYHAERATAGSDLDAAFLVMETKLLKVIIKPAMLSTWLFGLLLVLTPGVVDWALVWPWVKAVSVLAMTGLYWWLSARLKEFSEGRNTRSGRTYRIVNEFPTVLMFLIVFAVILRF